ncbi:RNA-directed DNA polymerase, partial [Gregarina niphandrodes]
RASVRVSQRRQQVSTVLDSGSLPVTDPVPVTVHGETDEVEFAVHDQPSVPNLLGRVELERFGLIERRSGKTLVLATQRGAVDEIRLAKKYKEQPPVVKEQSEDPFDRQRQVFVEGTGRLDQSLRDELWNLLVAYKDVWAQRLACVKARFEASGKPYKARLRHLEPELRAELEKQMEKQLKLGVIRPSKSEWVDRAALREEEDGRVEVRFGLPEAGRQHFTTLDMNSGFWNVAIAEESKHLTAFITPFGLFEFNVIPFGIKNSPAEFQHAMDMVFEKVLDDRTLLH